MAQLGVTELMTDPDFVDTISVISRTPTVNSKGENSLSESTVNTVGSVQPASGKTLARLPEALRVANVSSFWVKGVIPVTGAGTYPAILVFGSKRYAVQMVFDWSNFGEGYSEGTCVVEAPDGA